MAPGVTREPSGVEWAGVYNRLLITAQTPSHPVSPANIICILHNTQLYIDDIYYIFYV